MFFHFSLDFRLWRVEYLSYLKGAAAKHTHLSTMSKKRKGLSADEKRDVILNLYHTNKEVYNLKEIEQLGSKAGVVLQTVCYALHTLRYS